MSELYAIEKSTLNGIGSAIKGIKSKSGNMSVAQFENEIKGIATFTIDGQKVLTSKKFESEYFHIYKSMLPTDMTIKTCVVFNDELYLIGYTTDGYGRFYKLEGDFWTQIYSDTSNQVSSGSGLGNVLGQAVVFNNEIYAITHIGYGRLTKWNGTGWTNVLTLPKNSSNHSYGGTLVVYGNELHILGGSNAGTTTAHYKWDGTNLTSVGTMPVNVNGDSYNTIVYNNEIHVISHADNTAGLSHYKWDGDSWVLASTSPMSIQGGMAVLDGELHIFGGGSSGANTPTLNGRAHYKWDGNAWTALDDLPCYFYNGASAWAVLDNQLHLLGSNEHSINDHPAHYCHIIVGTTRYKEVTV